MFVVELTPYWEKCTDIQSGLIRCEKGFSNVWAVLRVFLNSGSCNKLQLRDLKVLRTGVLYGPNITLKFSKTFLLS